MVEISELKLETEKPAKMKVINKCSDFLYCTESFRNCYLSEINNTNQPKNIAIKKKIFRYVERWKKN